MISGTAGVIASLSRGLYPGVCLGCRLVRCNLVHTHAAAAVAGYHTNTVTKRHYDHKRRTNPDVIPSAIHNVQSIKSKWVEKFTDMNIPEPEVSAELIVAHVLGQKTVSAFITPRILCLLHLTSVQSSPPKHAGSADVINMVCCNKSLVTSTGGSLSSACILKLL